MDAIKCLNVGVLVSIFILTISVRTGGHICYECSSMTDDGCGPGRLQPPAKHHNVNCTGNCMKLVADMMTGEHKFVRTCDVTGFTTNTCVLTSHVLNFRKVIICVCDSFLCNVSTRTSIYGPAWITAIIISSLLLPCLS